MPHVAPPSQGSPSHRYAGVDAGWWVARAWAALVTALLAAGCGAEADSLTSETRCGSSCDARPTQVVQQNNQSNQRVTDRTGHACSLLSNIELSSPSVAFGEAEMLSFDLGSGPVHATTDFVGQELVMSVRVHNTSRESKPIPQGVVLDCGASVRVWNGGVWLSSLAGGQSARAEVIVQASPGDVRCTWSVTVDPDVPTNIVPECAASLDVAIALDSAR